MQSTWEAAVELRQNNEGRHCIFGHVNELSRCCSLNVADLYNCEYALVFMLDMEYLYLTKISQSIYTYYICNNKHHIMLHNIVIISCAVLSSIAVCL